MKKPLIVFFTILIFVICSFGQNGLKKYQNFDFSKRLLSRAELAKLEHEDLQKLRGIVFGKHGRIFIEKSIQQYLQSQSWYVPNAAFKNASLNITERKNIDLIREAEAAKHDYVEPGDLRFWMRKEIPEDKLAANTAATWRILMAEIEAIHGKKFLPDEPWLQKYFEERYWYKSNPKYSAKILTQIERKNLEAINKARDLDRKVAISPGDMDKFQRAPLKAEMLVGLSLNELRIMRNEFFARRGRRYETPGFRSFFEWQDWYRPIKDQSKVKLNPIEESNVKVIEGYERKIREKITDEPLTEEMLVGLFTEELRVLRNEIYARHGRIFGDKELQKTFEAMDWYKPNPDFRDDQLSQIERDNLKVIVEVEKNAVSKLEEIEG